MIRRFQTDHLIPVIVIVLLTILPSIVQAAEAQDARARFLQADAQYKQLRNNEKKIKYRQFWLQCIDSYQKVYKEDPQNSWAPAGMYAAAGLYLELYKLSFKKSDKDEGIDLLQRITKRFPSSSYSSKAKSLLKNLESPPARSVPESPSQSVRKESLKSKTIAPPEPVVRQTQAEPATEQVPSYQETGNLPYSPPAGLSGDALITGLRYWSNPEYTRVVIDADAERPFFSNLLKKDPSLQKPQRLYIDLADSRLGPEIPKITAINDDLLIQARAGQYTPHTVRVVVDLKSYDNYKIFSLKDPFRLVIDVWGKTTEAPGGKDTSSNQELVRLSTDNIHSSSIARQLALGVRKIVIDPGHGGKDPGAPGYFKDTWEKDVVLEIAGKLAQKMRDRLNCDVIMTRSTDKYLTLEERTAIANTKNADLFVSLHCNASTTKSLTGIETYFLNLATDDQAITVAARENATSRRNISDLESILNDLMKNAKINESSRLAYKVQESVCTGLRKDFDNINNLGVKQAPFYVLLGARMPSILVETSFLSNKNECKRLTSSQYQEKLCDAIIDGVESYISETNPKTL
ncbi:MAG: N-acetylmuramoyl-L-alanine amidase [Pseudomonadota bacterium]